MALSRRGFIKSLGAVSVLTVPRLLRAIAPQEKKLLLYHIHTGEWLKEVISYPGTINKDIFPKINHFMRDWRTDTACNMDPSLLTMLLRLKETLPSSTHFEVICGYRSLQTNQNLYRKKQGVARNSLHCKGKAVDLACPHINLRELTKRAKQIGMGGVGYYPASGFIHIDIRPRPAYW